MTVKNGSENRGIEDYKRGGTTRRETKNWRMVQEQGVGKNEVGTGSHGD